MPKLVMKLINYTFSVFEIFLNYIDIKFLITIIDIKTHSLYVSVFMTLKTFFYIN